LVLTELLRAVAFGLPQIPTRKTKRLPAMVNDQTTNGLSGFMHAPQLGALGVREQPMAVGNDLEEAERGGLGLVEQRVLLLAAHVAFTQMRAHQCFERRMASLRHPLALRASGCIRRGGEDNGKTPTAELAYFGESCAGWLGQ